MNKNYDLSWKLRHKGNIKVYEINTTVKSNGYYPATFNAGAFPKDFDTIKMEVTFRRNYYTTAIGASSYRYKYKPLSTEISSGAHLNSHVGLWPSDASGPNVGIEYKNIYESNRPFADTQYFSNMDINCPNRTTSSITSAGVNMPITGSITMEIPNPLLTTVGKRVQFVCQPSVTYEVSYYTDSYEYVTEDIQLQAGVTINWKSDGTFEVIFSPLPALGKSGNTVWSIKISGHGTKDIA
jgi:hypothetical protein